MQIYTPCYGVYTDVSGHYKKIRCRIINNLHDNFQYFKNVWIKNLPFVFRVIFKSRDFYRSLLLNCIPSNHKGTNSNFQKLL